MKQLLLALLLFAISTSFAQCPEGEVLLRSQADIEQFRNNFPGCTRLQSGLTISGNDITSLRFLNNITSVQQAITIINNPNLRSLSGLENITEFIYTPPLPPAPPQSGCISILNNPLLEHFNEFSNIVPVTNNGFISLKLEVKDNQSLLNLEGFTGISEAISFIDVTNNVRLTSLNGLENISFTISMRLEDNPVLNDISAIVNTTIGNSGVRIVGNTSLSECAVQSICNAITDNRGNVTIENNNKGCITIDEVDMRCVSLGITDVVNSSAFEVYPNPTENMLQLTANANQDFIQIHLYSLLGKTLFTTTNPLIDLSSYPKGIYLLVIETATGISLKRIIKN